MAEPMRNPSGNAGQTVPPQSETDRGATNEAELVTRIARKVVEFETGKKDSGGRAIDHLYFKRDDSYAIYASGRRILVAYSDEPSVANQQIADISKLLPSRDHLINLIEELPHQSCKENYRDQIADALRLALEKQSDVAKAIIEAAVHDAQEAQARIGRMIYLDWAVALALGVAFVLVLMGTYFRDSFGESGVHLLLMATGAGAIGALLSIAIGIRARTVAIDGNWQANAMDAALRVLIGVISAAVLFLLLNSGLLTNVQAGEVKFTGGDIKWQAALVIGFAAGFLERLVPDLMEKSAPPAQPAAAGVPAISSGVVSPGGAKAAG